MKVLPENFLRCLKPEDRKAMGQRTAAEVMANGVAKSEKELQKQIVGLLRLNGIEPNVSAMHKATTHRVGWPDITFAAYGVACAWEIKMPGGEESKEQIQMAIRLSTPPNCWRCRVIHSIDEALEELHQLSKTDREEKVEHASSNVEDAPRTGEIADVPSACALG